jgi:hypothetical protein
MTPCRLHLLKARDAPVVAVLRRGPSRWAHVAAWRWDEGSVTHGAWLHARLYPERSAISPSGELIATFVLDPRASSELEAYFAVSRLPWLHALAVWETLGTWTTGAHFESDRELLLAGGCGAPKPDRGSFPGDVSVSPVDTHWVRARLFRELRTGWTEGTADEPWSAKLPVPLEAHPDAVLVTRRSPREGDSRALLLVSLWEHQREYYVIRDGGPEALDGVVSAEWASDGSILAATRSGHLKMIGPDGEELWGYDMNRVEPDPRPAPRWATSW